MTRVTKDRRIRESPFEQGSGTSEAIAYKITIPTSWGTATFSGISCKLYEDPSTTNTDVSSTKLTGTASASGQVITTQTVSGLTTDKDYRLEVKFTCSEGNTETCWGLIGCTR